MNNRQKDIVLAALAAEDDAVFSPVQLQKMFFLIDQNISTEIGGTLFSFKPYDYGPFDNSVYGVVEELAREGFARVLNNSASPGRRTYSLTYEGAVKGRQKLAELSPPSSQYIVEVSRWVRSLSFSGLVGAIYNAYPEMREKSVFRD